MTGPCFTCDHSIRYEVLRDILVWLFLRSAAWWSADVEHLWTSVRTQWSSAISCQCSYKVFCFTRIKYVIYYFWLSSLKEEVMFLPFVCFSVCLSLLLLKKLQTDFSEIFWRHQAWTKTQSFRFWCGSRLQSWSRNFLKYSLFTVAIPVDGKQ